MNPDVVFMSHILTLYRSVHTLPIHYLMARPLISKTLASF
jgi:hypothetical protein